MVLTFNIISFKMSLQWPRLIANRRFQHLTFNIQNNLMNDKAPVLDALVIGKNLEQEIAF